MSQEKVAAAVIIALISDKRSQRKKRQKKKSEKKPKKNKRKNLRFYGCLLVELQLEDEYNEYYYKNYLQMTSENPISLRLQVTATIAFLSKGESYKSYVYEYYYFYKFFISKATPFLGSRWFSKGVSLFSALKLLMSCLV